MSLSNLWRGREVQTALYTEIEKKQMEGDTMLAVSKPPKSNKMMPRPAEPLYENYLKEYAELAELTGVHSPDLMLEAFKQFLRENDIPVFSLGEVVRYMDNKAKQESKEQAGWEWRPLREKDHRLNTKFGNNAERQRDNFGTRNLNIETPASDYYHGPQEIDFRDTGGMIIKSIRRSSQSPYDRTIPLHALRKVALIEKTFKDTVGMFVCDYAPAPAIEYPDPFLMAVIANPRVYVGEGRFVIDFWDEPGFELKQMLK